MNNQLAQADRRDIINNGMLDIEELLLPVLSVYFVTGT